MTVARVRTVQGIGDIFWVYQKLEPYFDELEFTVLTVDTTCPVQTRAAQFLSMLPRVKHTFEGVVLEEYNRVAQLKPHLPYVWAVGTNAFDYSVNRWLEEGVKLADIDKAARVLRQVDLGVPEPQLRTGLTVFVADSKPLDPSMSAQLWTPAHWATAALWISKQLRYPTLRIIGADWDRPAANALKAEIAKRGHTAPVYDFCGAMPLKDSIETIRSSEFFLGFQSGLNVIAENYDVPQLMVYFEHLRPMMHTWEKPGSTAYRAMTFGEFDKLEEILHA